MGELLKIPSDHRYDKNEFYGHYNLVPQSNYFIVTGTVRAPGRGKEIMKAVMQEFQQIANRRGITILHEFEAENEAGRKLIEQFAEYQLSDIHREDTRLGRNTWPIYTRTYTPQPSATT